MNNYEWRNAMAGYVYPFKELNLLTEEIKRLENISATQSKHLAQALKEKNNAHELLDIERRRHERHMNDLQREASRRLADTVAVNTRNDYLMNLIASADYLQPPAPIVIESKELFERNQSLQKEIEEYRVEVKKLRDFNGNQYDTIRKMREEQSKFPPEEFWGRGFPEPEFNVGQLLEHLRGRVVVKDRHFSGGWMYDVLTIDGVEFTTTEHCLTAVLPKFRVGQLAMQLMHASLVIPCDGSLKDFRVVKIEEVVPFTKLGIRQGTEGAAFFCKYSVAGLAGARLPENWFRALRPEEIS